MGHGEPHDPDPAGGVDRHLGLEVDDLVPRRHRRGPGPAAASVPGGRDQDVGVARGLERLPPVGGAGVADGGVEAESGPLRPHDVDRVRPPALGGKPGVVERTRPTDRDRRGERPPAVVGAPDADAEPCPLGAVGDGSPVKSEQTRPRPAPSKPTVLLPPVTTPAGRGSGPLLRQVRPPSNEE